MLKVGSIVRKSFVRPHSCPLPPGINRS
jgi:2'-phosphotransferase